MIAIDIRILRRVFELSLEDLILVEVETTVPTVCHGQENTDNTSRYGDHHDLYVCDIESMRDGNRRECHYRGGDRGAGDTNLTGDRGDATRAFGANTLLQGYITDDRHQGIHHVSRADENGQEERREGSQQRDAVGMFTEQTFGNLYHPVHTARSL